MDKFDTLINSILSEQYGYTPKGDSRPFKHLGVGDKVLFYDYSGHFSMDPMKGFKRIVAKVDDNGITLEHLSKDPKKTFQLTWDNINKGKYNVAKTI